MQTVFSYTFASDNTAPATPEAFAALVQANTDEPAASYGSDSWTQKAIAALREYFEAPQAEIFFVFSGTAANALALAALRQPFESVFCTHEAHIEKDESAAPEFFAQGLKLHLIGDSRGDKVDLKAAARMLAGNRGMHSAQPRALSISQASEFGTCYSVSELADIKSFCQNNQLFLHMDGARFGNALAQLNASPAQISWRAGVDVLSLGGTKNGVCTSEALIFFKPELARGFANRRKQGGQLLSKMRYLAAPWLGALPKYVERARHANQSAQHLADSLRRGGLRLAFPVEANGVFVHLPEALVEHLHARGWHFYKFLEPDVYRFMCAWNCAEVTIQALLQDFQDAL